MEQKQALNWIKYKKKLLFKIVTNCNIFNDLYDKQHIVCIAVNMLSMPFSLLIFLLLRFYYLPHQGASFKV